MARPALVRRFYTAALLTAAGCTAAAPPSPSPAPGPPAPRVLEGVAFPSDASMLFFTPEQQRVGYRGIQHLAPTRRVAAGPRPPPLPRATRPLADFRYAFGDSARTLDDFVREMNVAGLLVLHDGAIVVERYAQGNDEHAAWTSFSVAKSVLSMLYGAAIQDGSIHGMDDRVTDYLPALRGSAYDGVTLRTLLQMSSGAAWNEDYADPSSDVANLGRAGGGGIDSLLAYMARLPRAAPPGTRYNYSTGETHVAGAVLRAATGRPLAEYLGEKIWRPAGMEADAFWLLLREGDLEHGGCCLSATLRDFGRLGLLAMRDGVAPDGTRLLADGWMAESVSPAPTRPAYGYFWWLGPGRSFYANGIFGQHVYVDPARSVVIVLQSTWPAAGGRELSAHRTAFLEAMTRAVSGDAAATR